MGAPKHAIVQKVRITDDGKIIKPALFNGLAAGQGKYFAAMIDGQLIYDAAGKPVPFKAIGKLAYPL